MKKLLFSAILAFALIAAQVGVAFAQDTTTLITGTVQSVALETDATTGETTVVVTLLDDQGATQTVNLSVETARSIGLVTTDQTTGETTVATDAVGKTVEIDPTTVTGDGTGEEEKEHPVGSALADFFGEILGVDIDYDAIMTYHEEGVGFGVIVRALWLTSGENSTTTFDELMYAKINNDYEGIILEDGSEARNWGDVVKSLKKGDNLGRVMSGKGETSDDEANAVSEGNNNKNNNKDEKGKKDKGNKGNGNGNGNSDGNGNGNGHGNGD